MLKSPQIIQGPGLEDRVYESSVRNSTLSASDCGPYTTVINQGSWDPTAHRLAVTANLPTAMVAPVQTSVRHPNNTPPETFTAGNTT